MAYYPATGAEDQLLLKTEADGDVYAYRLRTIQQRLRHFLEGRRVEGICMERAAFNASGAFTAGLVHAATALALLDLFEGSTLVAPRMVVGSTLKKYAIGRGSAPKSLMLLAVYKKWGFDTTDDNLADAYSLARLAAAVAFGRAEHKYEQEVLDTLKKSEHPWEPPPPPTVLVSPPGRAASKSRSRTSRPRG